jgi:hypothetical protein
MIQARRPGSRAAVLDERTSGQAFRPRVSEGRQRPQSAIPASGASSQAPREQLQTKLSR